jgi:multicomponent Na+:H+ antiporter subunit E
VRIIELLRRAGRLSVFSAWYASLVLRANMVVAWDALTPRSRLAPGIVELPLHSRTSFEVATVANLVSLTPGTLTLAVRRDPPTLWVHGMYSPDAEEFRSHLHDLESRLLHALRSPDEETR